MRISVLYLAMGPYDQPVGAPARFRGGSSEIPMFIEKLHSSRLECGDILAGWNDLESAESDVIGRIGWTVARIRADQNVKESDEESVGALADSDSNTTKVGEAHEYLYKMTPQKIYPFHHFMSAYMQELVEMWRHFDKCLNIFGNVRLHWIHDSSATLAFSYLMWWESTHANMVHVSNGNVMVSLKSIVYPLVAKTIYRFIHLKPLNLGILFFFDFRLGLDPVFRVFPTIIHSMFFWMKRMILFKSR